MNINYYCALFTIFELLSFYLQLVVLKDPNEDQDDILRANRSREKQYIFDCAFGPNSNQVIEFNLIKYF